MTNDASVEIDLGNFLREDGITVTLGGVIDWLSMPLIETSVFSEIERGCQCIVFNFKDLVSIDAEPLGFINACSKILSERGGKVVIVNASSQIINLFQLLEFDHLLYREPKAPSTSTVALNASHYAVLEIEPNATQQEIQEAYRILASVWHPDRFPQGSKQWAKANEKMTKIHQAYQVLKKR